jgi:uncharacterized membrane protein YphA (DoxX/SURF4 family)
MNIGLWIIQIFLAFAFLVAGLVKVVLPTNQLEDKLGKWVNDFSKHQIKLIGTLEILGAIGLILPMWLNIYPILTPMAAIGLGLTMMGAIWTNARVMKKNPDIFKNVIFLMLTIIVVIGRLYIIPVQGL